MSAHSNRRLSGVLVAAAIFFCRNIVAAEVRWSTNIEDSLQQAAAQNQLVLMEFTADWCVFCKKMEKNTFTNPNVAQRIEHNFVAVKVDADQNKGLVSDLGIKGLPAILVVSPDLRVVERISGFQTPEALIPKLDAITAAHVSQNRPPAMAGTQSPQRRPQQRPIPQNSYNPPAAAANPPVRQAPGELQLEAITQEEAPRVGVRRNPVPSQNPIFDGLDLESRQPERGMSQAANPSVDSVFKTISREQQPRNEAPKSSGPSFQGLCIVSAFDERELVEGNARNQINYKGQTLFFSSVENKERFEASPGTYWPMLDGACALTLVQDEKRVEGSLEFAAVFRKRIWLFSSQAAMQEFLLDPADVAEEAIEYAAALQR